MAVLLNLPLNPAIASSPAIQALAWPWRPIPPRQAQTSRLRSASGNGSVRTRKKLELATLLSSGCIPEEQPNRGPSKARVWLPRPPSMHRPRATHNAASLAYLGDCVYELYVRCHFFTPPQNIDAYNHLVMGLVCCEAQDALIKQLLKDDFLSADERNIVKWGRNVQSGQKKATRRAGAAVYCGASSLETLIGHLYLTNVNRLEEVMNKLGFHSRSSVNQTA